MPFSVFDVVLMTGLLAIRRRVEFNEGGGKHRNGEDGKGPNG